MNKLLSVLTVTVFMAVSFTAAATEATATTAVPADPAVKEAAPPVVKAEADKPNKKKKLLKPKLPAAFKSGKR